MRVLVSGMGWIYEDPGGLNRYLADYTRSLKYLGHSVKAIVRVKEHDTKSWPGYVEGVYTGDSLPVAVARRIGREILAEAERGHWDVYNPHFAFYALFAAQKMHNDLPVVVNFHGPWAYEAAVEKGRSSISNHLSFKIRRAIEKRVYKHCDRFIVLSSAFRDVLVKHYHIAAEQIHIIPGAVDTEHFKPTSDRSLIRYLLDLPENGLILLAVRRLVKRMGLENLIEAVAALKDSFPSIKLVIVGDGELRAELTDLVARNGLTNCVQLVGRVPDEKLPMYYQAADLTVVPSIALEGFGLTTVESMACGTPVAGTPVGGTSEILNGFCPDLLFPGLEAAAITESLGELLSKPWLIPNSNVIRKHVLDHYTWPVVTNKIIGVFRQAASHQTWEGHGQIAPVKQSG